MRRPKFCRESTTSITPSPAERPTTAGPRSTAACGFAAVRPGRITSASRLRVSPLPALFVVPNGMEEGTSIDVPSGEFGLVVGEPATFRFFSSATRKQDRPGDLVEQWTEEEIGETDSLEANLPAAANAE